MTLGHNICQQGYYICIDYIDTFQPVAIPSATMAITSASHKVAIPSATINNEGLSETFKNICKRYGIEVHFKSGKTIQDELVAPKDKDHITKKCGVFTAVTCGCSICYIGQKHQPIHVWQFHLPLWQ